MKKTFGLLGEKLDHSFSPLIHSFLGDYEYNIYEVSPDRLDSFMTERRFAGINVTIPYKQAVLPFCKTLSEEAQKIGCVNTIIKDDNGELHGYNTDYFGFKTMLEYGGINPAGKKVVVLGDGASARTVRAVLNDFGAMEIVTVSRLGENNYSNIAQHYDAELLVNTTPVGMFPNNGILPSCIKGFKQLTGIADLIYNPLKTKMMLDAGRLGIPCTNGLSMLVAQAELASRLFLDVADKNVDAGKSDMTKTKSIIGKVLSKIQNIAIIGMPGCGKSTVGRVLAEKMERQFVDIDEMIEATAGKSINEIFTTVSEDQFRDIETNALSEESKKSGLVIATGGGVVTRPENLDLLRQNSVIIYLKRDLSELKTTGRPLSNSVGIEKLAEQRLPLYEQWSDCTVQAGADVEQTATRILEIFEDFISKNN